MPERFGLYGYCSDGVLEKIKHEGGDIVFGWTIWEWPNVLLNAEFHAVWRGIDGRLLDITPKPGSEQFIWFVPDRSFPLSFDFDNRPLNRRMKSYKSSEVFSKVQNRISGFSPAQREYETKRATRAGRSLENWVESKSPLDPIPALIDELITVCGKYEAAMDAAPALGIGLIRADRALQDLMRLKVSVLDKLRSHLRNDA